ncbi:MAG TPA: MFS transporter, partial [Roseiarcus sp.]
MAKRGVYYGWFVAGATFVVMLATAGAMGAPGVIIQPLEKEFGWSTEEISVALAVRLALFGLIGPFAAALINRFGVRPVVVSAIAMIVLGILGSMAMTEVWQLIALWGVVVGIGTGMVALVLGATIAARWFVHRRGLVVGMLTASNATGQLIFLPLIARLTEAYGWRNALAFVVAMLLVAGAVALMLLRDRPVDVGLAPFGERAIQPAPKQ